MVHMAIIMNFVIVIATTTVDGIKLNKIFHLHFFSQIILMLYEGSIMLLFLVCVCVRGSELRLENNLNSKSHTAKGAMLRI